MSWVDVASAFYIAKMVLSGIVGLIVVGFLVCVVVGEQRFQRDRMRQEKTAARK